MVKSETRTDQQPPVGQVTEISPNIRRIIAPNPSPMTYWGTNTYLLGTREIAIIDPGPMDSTHLHRILGALRPGQRITHILVTHAHLDHSPLARPLADATGAKVCAFGDALAGRSEVMQRLVGDGLTTGGEGVDHGFLPDICLKDGDIITGDGWEIEAIWTPGHMANHMSFNMQDIVFTGDHVMGWASSLVSPPDGDIAAFMWSCQKLQARNAKVYLPGHGGEILDPAARIQWLIDHRKARETSILSALTDKAATIPELTKHIYSDVSKALFPAAERNVFAHIIDLHTRAMVTAVPQFEFTATFALK